MIRKDRRGTIILLGKCPVALVKTNIPRQKRSLLWPEKHTKKVNTEWRGSGKEREDKIKVTG